MIEALIKFTNTTNYVNKVQSFMESNCAGFESYNERLASGEGNKLEWMDLFREYQDMIDEELESFCRENDTNPSEMFDIIDNYVNQSRDEDFIPLFLKTMNEEHFFEQMCACASEVSKEEKALETLQNEEKGENSMSGIWYLVPESIDAEDLQNWLTVLGMPWPFKKLFKSAHKKPMKSIINHVPGRIFEISIAIPFFGTWSINVKLNGDWGTGKDRVGRPLRLLGEEESNGDVTMHVKDRSGSLMLVFLSMTGPSSIRMHREFYSGGVDIGSANADAKLTCSFKK